MDKTEYAEGVWCVDCEMFEAPDFAEIETTDGRAVTTRCLGCGCPAPEHRDVKVVDR